VNLEVISRNIRKIKNIDRSVHQLQRAIIWSYYHNGPAKITRLPRNAPCWNKELSGLKHETYLIQRKEQGSGMPIRKTTPVIIKEKGNPNDFNGGGTAR
jgi:hypothetical protein